ncbi:DMT family transporter [Chthonobacter rhizosphaerae]|uniref:DMT family transporter n=1 Tax=Chthonobacter rhizosphaerae TaxID=2735553 RepID=UPI0015EF51A7|nr:DMT family transporter [Chthonobacter rhizosphaerae]
MTLLVDSARRMPAAFRRLPPDLAASGLMLASFLVFTAMAVLARTVGDTIPVIEMVFVRQVAAFVFMAPLYARFWPAIRAPRRLGLHAARGVAAVGAMMCGLSAVIWIPLADATAIQMTEALFATAFAGLILRERVGWRRWLAAAAGIAGVAIMIRPFGGGLDVYALVALAGAISGAFGMILVRLGSEYDRTETVMFWQGVVVLVLVTPLAAIHWVTPSLDDAVLLFVMSLIFTIGQWLFTAALRMGDTSALAPLHYLRLIMMAAVGWFLYGEVPTLATAAGAVLILGAATYTLRANARPDRRPPPSRPI